MNHPFHIKKASGEMEPFSRVKLSSSLARARVPARIAQEVVNDVEARSRPGIPTKEIYQTTMQSLKQRDLVLSLRYGLKGAIMQMGPSGHPFEKYIGSVLTRYGYTTSIRQMVSGKCIQHEFDVIAQKEDRRIIVECKYHNRQGTKSDVGDALYTYARFLDIQNKHETQRDARAYEAWVVTNTKSTNHAIAYARCVGMHIVGWGYPPKQNLQHLIEDKGLYPITILPGLSRSLLQQLLQDDIVLASDFFDEMLSGIIKKKTQMSTETFSKLQAVARALCSIE